jgi:transposase
MDDKTLYSQILGLSSPWEVTDVSLDLEEETVTIYISYNSKSAPCPICNAISSIYDKRRSRSWRHLDTCQMKTIIEGSIPRIKCSKHGVRSISSPLSDSYSQFTYLFESYAIKLLQATQNQTKVAEVLRISFSQVHDIMKKAVNRGLERRKSTDIEYIGIDEKSMKRGHSYLTVVSNFNDRTVIDVCEDRTKEATIKLFNEIKDKNNTLPLKAISMDMWKAFIQAAKEVFPEADIVYDRFHIMKYLNDGVNKTRIEEVKELTKLNDKTLNRSKYLWLKNEQNMTESQVERFNKIKELDIKTSKAWRIKESFKAIFECKSKNEVKTYFSRWLNDVYNESIEQMIKVAETIKGHIDGIINYSKHKISNGIAENINGKIQRIKTVARGFRAFNNYRIAILFHLGGLDLFPHRF